MKHAACTLIEQRGRYLAVSRKTNPDMWGLVGGKVDPFETVHEAAQRELMEETGIVAGQPSFLPLYSGLCVAQDDGSAFWVTTYLWCDTPIMQDEIKAEPGLVVRWKTREELTDPATSPFARYNELVFYALDVYKDGKKAYKEEETEAEGS